MAKPKTSLDKSRECLTSAIKSLTAAKKKCGTDQKAFNRLTGLALDELLDAMSFARMDAADSLPHEEALRYKKRR